MLFTYAVGSTYCRPLFYIWHISAGYTPSSEPPPPRRTNHHRVPRRKQVPRVRPTSTTYTTTASGCRRRPIVRPRFESSTSLVDASRRACFLIVPAALLLFPTDQATTTTTTSRRSPLSCEHRRSRGSMIARAPARSISPSSPGGRGGVRLPLPVGLRVDRRWRRSEGGGGKDHGDIDDDAAAVGCGMTTWRGVWGRKAETIVRLNYLSFPTFGEPY